MKNGEIIWFVELQNVAVFNLHENVIVEWNQNIIEDTKLIHFLNEMRTSKIPIFSYSTRYNYTINNMYYLTLLGLRTDT